MFAWTWRSSLPKMSTPDNTVEGSVDFSGFREWPQPVAISPCLIRFNGWWMSGPWIKIRPKVFRELLV